MIYGFNWAPVRFRETNTDNTRYLPSYNALLCMCGTFFSEKAL